jgi:hypothetical protein
MSGDETLQQNKHEFEKPMGETGNLYDFDKPLQWRKREYERGQLFLGPVEITPQNLFRKANQLAHDIWPDVGLEYHYRNYHVKWVEPDERLCVFADKFHCDTEGVIKVADSVEVAALIVDIRTPNLLFLTVRWEHDPSFAYHLRERLGLNPNNSGQGAETLQKAKSPVIRERGPSDETQERFALFSRIKEENPTFSKARVAMEANNISDLTNYDAQTVSNVYRAMGMKWPSRGKQRPGNR